MITLNNKPFLRYWRQPIFYKLLVMNALLVGGWFCLTLYHGQATTRVHRLESFHDEHLQQQRLHHVLKKGRKNAASLMRHPLTSKDLKKQLKKIAKHQTIQLHDVTTTPQPLPHLCQLALTSSAFLEDDCFSFVSALQQTPGFLGIKEIRLQRNDDFIDKNSLTPTQTGVIAPFTLQLTLLWGFHSGGTKS